MSYSTLNDLEKYVVGLMDAEDELGWQHEGLFTRVDALGGVLGPSLPVEVDLTTKNGFTPVNLTYDITTSTTQRSIFNKPSTPPSATHFSPQTENYQPIAQASHLKEKFDYPSQRVRSPTKILILRASGGKHGKLIERLGRWY
jgi:hypothetical protein